MLEAKEYPVDRISRKTMGSQKKRQKIIYVAKDETRVSKKKKEPQRLGRPRALRTKGGQKWDAARGANAVKAYTAPGV